MLQDRRGGSGRLMNLLRVNNDLFCDLAALVTFDDSQSNRWAATERGCLARDQQLHVTCHNCEHLHMSQCLLGCARRISISRVQHNVKNCVRACKICSIACVELARPSGCRAKIDCLRRAASAHSLKAKFLRYKNVPGLAVGHPAVVYDNVTDLYWMASNVNRDSGRRWKQPHTPQQLGGDNPGLHITPFSKCEVSTLSASRHGQDAISKVLDGYRGRCQRGRVPGLQFTRSPARCSPVGHNGTPLVRWKVVACHNFKADVGIAQVDTSTVLLQHQRQQIHTIPSMNPNSLLHSSSVEVHIVAP